MKSTLQEKKNARKGWFVATVCLCLFLISASFVSCWDKPDPFEVPGEVMIAFGDTDFGSGESASASQSSSSTDSPQEEVEETSNNSAESPSDPITDPDSDAIPEKIKDTDNDQQNQTNQTDPNQAQKDKLAKEQAEKEAKLKAEQEAQAEKDRLAKIAADKKAQEERDAAAALGGNGNTDQQGNQGKKDGTDNSGNGGNSTIAGSGKGAPSGWRLVKEPGNLQVSQRAKVTIKYKINSSGKVLSVTDVIAPTLTNTDKENIKREIMKLEFKPINEADIKPGSTYSGIYTWDLNY